MARSTGKKVRRTDSRARVGPSSRSRREDGPFYVPVLGHRDLFPVRGTRDQRAAAIAREQRGRANRTQLLTAKITDHQIGTMARKRRAATTLPGRVRRRVRAGRRADQGDRGVAGLSRRGAARQCVLRSGVALYPFATGRGGCSYHDPGRTSHAARRQSASIGLTLSMSPSTSVSTRPADRLPRPCHGRDRRHGDAA